MNSATKATVERIAAMHAELHDAQFGCGHSADEIRSDGLRNCPGKTELARHRRDIADAEARAVLA